MQQTPVTPDKGTADSRAGVGTAAAPTFDAGEPVWTYRGYRLRSGDFTTAMVHFFRAEIQRANVWRQRLDTTTNWAVLSTGAVISFAFSQNEGHHSLILLSILLVTVFLLIESRRYRYYELWSYRVRLMETDFYANMLVPPFSPSPEWAEKLSQTLLQSEFPITTWEAFGRRLRRNYLAIYFILLVAWLAKLGLHPTPAITWAELIPRAGIAGVQGRWVLIAVMAFAVVIIMVAVLTAGLQKASGEVFTHPQLGKLKYIRISDRQRQRKAPWLQVGRPRQMVMTLIVTNSPEVVAKQILKQMNRGVTSIEGTGMFSGNTRHVLLCVLAASEINRLKAMVSKEDSGALVIILPTQEILGKGFVPLTAPS